jgi:hypothetical protein
MPEMTTLAAGSLDPAQAKELAQLVEMEARWENLRTSAARPAAAQPDLQDLHRKQKAYEAFHTKLAWYNKRYSPVHVAELLLNTPIRLGTWCRSMRALVLRVETHPQGYSPVHLLEKAHRWADRLAVRIHITPLTRPAAPVTLEAAVQDLQSIAQWCDELLKTEGVKVPA